MTFSNTTLDLLHITDPTLPIGGFSHSNGLETYVQKGLLHDSETTLKYISNILKYSYKHNDGFFCKEAHRLISEDKDMSMLTQLDNEWDAFITPSEISMGSKKLGIRLLKIYQELMPNDTKIEEIRSQVKSKQMIGHIAILFGAITAILRINSMDNLLAFYYNATVAMVTNSVKLIPLGQIEGQKILHQTHPLIEQTALETLSLEPKYAGMCMPSLDIRCMQHEYLYSRLYMS